MTEVRVLWAAADAPARGVQLLTVAERARLEELPLASDRDEFLSAHVLARILVADMLDIRAGQVRITSHCVRCGGPHGPPVAGVPGGGGPFISFSHAGGLAIAVAARTPVGVDVEPVGALRPGVDEAALAPREQAHLATLPIDRRGDAITTWWVRKEAVLKATRRGLDVEPRHVVLSPPEDPPRLVEWTTTDAPTTLRLAEVDVGPGHTACLAVESRDTPVVAVDQVVLSEGRW